MSAVLVDRAAAAAPRHTERLVMRPVRMDDVPRAFEIHGDPRANLFNPDGPRQDLAHEHESMMLWVAHWREHGFGKWAVATLDEPGRAIGFGGLTWRDYAGSERINLGYKFAPEAWGRGYATEFAREALRFAFDVLALPEVNGLVRPANLASLRVLRKIGMPEVGTLADVPGEVPSVRFRLERLPGR